MTTVDNRVVAVKFDNSGFQDKIAGTQKSLEGLKQSLKFDGATEGISNIQTGLNRINLGPLSVAVDGVSTKFLALATAGVAALGTIVSKATAAGAQIVKSLAITPILDGYREYETNMTSIQTILSNTKSKGSNLEDVNKALDELNKYSDQTIYNFGEMTKNIGTFTAAGVGLDKSVSSIKGIANLAALSGSNSQQASTAMYQLSQSIAAGSVKLMDWNSVVNAGMGGEIFQKALFETGKQMKTIAGVPMDMTFEQWTKAGNTFRGSLEKGWLTADVLTTTLTAFTGDLDAAQLKAMGYTDQQAKEMMDLAATAKAAATDVKTATQLVQVVKESIGSGWSQSFRTIVGDFEESKQLFSGLYGYFNGIISRSAEARNNLLDGWKAFNGRDTLVQGLTLGLNALQTAVAPIRLAFREFFPKTTVEQLLNFTNGFRDLMLRLTAGPVAVQTIYGVFSAFFSTLKVGWTILKGVFDVLGSLFGVFTAILKPALAAVGLFGIGIKKLNGDLLEGNITSFFDKISGSIDKFGKLIASVLAPAFQALGDVAMASARGFRPFVGTIDEVLNLGGKFTEFAMKVKSSIEGLFSGNESDGAKKVGESVGLVEGALNKLSGVAAFFSGIWDKLVGGFSAASSTIAKVGDVIKEAVGKLWNAIKEAFSPEAFGSITKGVNVGLLGGLLFYFRKFVNDGIKIDFGGGFLESIKDAFGALTGNLEAMQKRIKADTLFRIAKAMAVIAVSVAVLALIDPKRIASALTALVVGFGSLVATMVTIDKLGLSGFKLIGIALGLSLLATAVIILSVAMKILSGLSWTEIFKGFVALTGLIVVFNIAAKILGDQTIDLIQTSISLIALSVAIGFLAISFRAFAGLSFQQIGSGLLGMAGTLLIVIQAIKRLPENIKLKSIGLLTFAFALRIMAVVIQEFGKNDFATTAKGLFGIAAVLTIMTVAIKNLPKNLGVTAIQLIAVAAAVAIMAVAVKLLGDMKFESIATGIIAIALVMTILAAAAYAMEAAQPGAISIAILAASLFVLSKVLTELSKLSLKEIGISLLAIAGVLAVFGLMALVLQPVIPAMLGLAIAMGLLGLAFALVGAGAYLVAKALTEFAVAGVAGTKTFVAIIDALIVKLPALIQAFILGLINGFVTILEYAPRLVKLLVNVLSSLIDGLVTLIPKLGQLIGVLIDTVIKLIMDKTPALVEAGWFVLMSLLDGIKNHMEDLVTTVGDIIINFINGLTEALPKIIDAGANLIVALLTGIAADMKKINDAGLLVVVSMLDGISKNVTTLITAGANLIINIIRGIGDNLGRIITEGVKVILKFLQGIKDNIQLVIDGGWALVIGVLDGLTKSIKENAPTFRRKAKELVEAIIEGFGFDLKQIQRIKDAMLKPFTAAWDGVKKLFGWNSPAKAATDLAGGLAEGLKLGLKQNTSGSVTDMTNYGKKVKTALEKSISDANLSMSGISNFNPVIAPVLDLSGVRSEAGKIGGILDGNSITASVSYDQASVVSALSEQVAAIASAQTQTGPTEIKFEQNNYSPESLSVNDIYRQTRSQIELAKQELNVS